MAGRKKRRSTKQGSLRKRRGKKKLPEGFKRARRDTHKAAPSLAARFAAAQPRLAEVQKLRKADKVKRSRAAKKGAATRRAKAAAALRLTSMLNLAAAGSRSKKSWNAARAAWHASKWELFDAVEEDRERYLDILDDIADETDCPWQIAYGPEADS